MTQPENPAVMPVLNGNGFTGARSGICPRVMQLGHRTGQMLRSPSFDFRHLNSGDRILASHWISRSNQDKQISRIKAETPAAAATSRKFRSDSREKSG